MQKFLRTLTLLALMLVPWVSQAQNTLTVADGTNTNGYVPVYGYYADAYLNAQFVYPAADVAAMNGTEILSMTFYATQTNVSWGNAHYKVYLTETEAATISAFSATTDMTLVYDGPLSISGGTMVIPFDDAYAYNGGNLQVAVIQDVIGSYVTSTWRGTTSSGSSVQGYSYSSLSAISPTQRNFLPKVTFAYEAPATCKPVSGLVAEAVNGVSVDVAWNTPYGGSTGYVLTYKPAGATTITTVTTTDTTYTLTGLIPDTTYEIAVRNVCSAVDSSNWRGVTVNTDPIEVSNLAAVTTVGTAMVAWNAPTTPVVNYQLKYKVAGSTTDSTTVTILTTDFLVTGLDANTDYEISVRANCGTNLVSDWTTITVTTDNFGCIDGLGNVQIGEGTSTSSYFPAYNLYDYSYSQQIYTASEIGASGAIQGLAVMPSSVNVSAVNRDIEIYLGHCTVATATDWLNPSDLTLVFSGSSNYVANEWSTFTFTTPFNYNGTDNLVVIVRDMTGSWSSSNSFYVHDVPSGTTAELHRDGTSYPVGTPGGTYSGKTVRNNMLFLGSCNQYAVCAAPTVAVTAVMDNSVNIDWIPGYHESAWDLAYRADTATEWITVATGLTERKYTFSNLDGNTDYLFRVQYACSDENNYAAIVRARTLCTLALPYTEDFEGVAENKSWPECWNRIITYITYPWVSNNFNHTEGEEAQYSMYLQSSYSTEYYNMFASAPIHAAGNDIYVSFWARMASSNLGSPYIQAGVMTDLSDTSTFIPLVKVETRDGQWHQYEFCTKNLDPNATYFVAWKYRGYSSSYPSAIDDIVIDTIPEYDVNLVLANQANEAAAWGTVEATALHVLWGDTVTFTATPNEFKRLAAWYDGTDLATANILGEDTNILKICVTSDTAITAYFGYGQFEITTKANYDAMGSINALNNVYNNNMYDYASLDTFVAVPNYGYQFVQWYDTDSNLVLGTEDTLVLEVLRGYRLVARFGIAGYSIDAVTEHGQVEGLGVYNFGHLAEVTAVPDEHYEFAYWSDAIGDTVLSTAQTISVRMTRDTTLYPVFTPMSYEVSFATVIDGEESNLTIATYTGEGTFTYLDEDTVRISNVNEHYVFNGWSIRHENNEVLHLYFPNDDTDEDPIFVTLDEEGEITSYYDYDWDNFQGWNPEYRQVITGAEYDGEQLYDWPITYYTYENVEMAADSSYAFVVENNTVFAAQFVSQQYTVTIASADPTMGSVNFTDEALEGVYTVTVPYLTPVEIHVDVINSEYSHFIEWSDGNSEQTRTIVVTQDSTLTASFGVATYAAAAHIVVNGNVDPTEYDLNDVATLTLSTYEPAFGTPVTATAVAGEHWVFKYWYTTNDDGGNMSTENPYSEFVFGGTTNFYAVFEPDTHAIVATIADATFGSVSVENAAVAHFDDATVTYTDNSYDPTNDNADINGQIYGLPGYGYHFAGWVDTNDNFVSNDNPFTFEVSQDTVLVATVEPNLYNVMATSANVARGTVGVKTMATDNYDYAYLTEATLLYDTAYGYRFGWWANEAGDSLSVARNYKPVVRKDTAIVANFVEDLFAVAGAPVATCGMMGYVTGSTTAEYGEEVTLTAVTNNGYEFDGWVDAQGNALTADGYSIIAIDDVNQTITLRAGGDADHQWMDNDTAVYALYSFMTYAVDVVVEPDPAYGTVTGTMNNHTLSFPDDFGYSSRLNLTAEPADHYDFVAWIDQISGDTLSTAANYIHTVTGEAIIEAHFTPERYTVTLASDDETKGTASWDATYSVEQTVADGTATSNQVPVYGLYTDTEGTKSQTIYPASMLSDIEGGVITGLTYYLSTPAAAAWTATFEVKVAEVEETAFATAEALNPATATTVFTGTLDATSSTMEILFNEPYTYNGGNLLVDIAVTETGNFKSASFLGAESENSSFFNYSNDSYTESFIPKTTFTATITGEIPGVEIDGMTAYADYNRAVTMKAEAKSGYDFIGWFTKNAEGVVNVNDDGDTIFVSGNEVFELSNIDRDSNLVAFFSEHMYAVVATTNGVDGTVEADPASASNLYPYNSEVTLTATATDGNHMHFAYWLALDANGDTVKCPEVKAALSSDPEVLVPCIISTENPMTITVDQDTHFVAVFEIDQHTVAALPNDEDFGGVYVEEESAPAPAGLVSLTIHDGTATNGYVPIYGFYADAYLKCQFIYPAAELADINGAVIDSLTFYATTPASDTWGSTWQVRLTEVADATISEYNDLSDATLVYEGPLDGTQETMTIPFSTPYNYQGGNLLVSVYNVSTGNYKSVTWKGESVAGSCVQGYNYGSLDGVSATQRNFLPKVTIDGKFSGGASTGTEFEAQIGDGTSTMNYFPFYTLYNYSIAENLFLASELTEAGVAAGTITSLSWNATNEPGYEQQGISIWMANVSDEELTTTSHVATDMTEVYSDGSMTPAIGWNEFVLNGDFSWDGTSNVLILVQRNNGDWNSTVSWQSSTTGFNSSAYRYQDSGPYDVTIANTMYVGSTRPNIIIKGEAPAAGPEPEVPYAEASEATVDYNTTGVKVYAKANENYHFKYWTDEAGNIVREPATVDPMADFFTVEPAVLNDTTFIAVFAPDTFAVYTLANDVQGYVTPEDTVGAYNEQVTLTAVANDGYQFDHWAFLDSNNELVEAANSTTNPLVFTVTKDTAAVAIFDFKQYALNVNVENGTVSVNQGALVIFDSVETVDSSFYYGTQLILTANGGEHYNNFKGWYDADENLVSENAVYNVTIFDDAAYTAKFEVDTHFVTLTVNDITMGEIEGAATFEPKHAYGEEITLNAVAAAGYHWTTWMADDVAIDATNPMTYTVTDDVTLKAVFAVNVYDAIAALEEGDEDNEVSGTTTGVEGGTNVTFTATAAEGYTFDEWRTVDGDSVSDLNPLTVTVNSDTTLVAHFNANVYTITLLTPFEEMGVAIADQTLAFYGDSVTFTALPEYGYHFVNWTDENGLDTAVATLKLKVTSDIVLTAHFAYDTFTVVANSTDVNRGTVIGAGDYPYGSIVTLTAVPVEGFEFKQWVDQDENIYTTADITVVVDADKEYTAYFITAGEFTVTATAAHGTVTGVGGYEEGETATLTVTADYGYAFAGWYINNELVGTDATLSIVVTQDTTVVAQFTTNTYNLTLTAVNGTVTGAGSYAYNTTATITATPNAHYHFVMWSDGNINANRTLTIIEDTELEAIFALDEFTVTAVAVNGTVSGAGLYTYGSTVTLTATPASACYSFNGWMNGSLVVSTNPTYTFTANEDVTLSAVFTAMSFTETVNADVCGTSYSWNGQTYTATGLYEYQTTTLAGCDSVVTLALVLNTPMNTTENATACDSYTWNGHTYTTSGTVTSQFVDIHGCDATATLVLTINQSKTGTETVTNCGPYTWNGTSYATSGDYVANLTASNGCDSTVTLHLTIGSSSSTTETVSTCSSYTWNGQTYTTSGTYTYATTGATGCDSIVTLNLTITPAVEVVIPVEACSSYTWEGYTDETYTTSGTYTYSTDNGEGCLTIYYLQLTINQPVYTNLVVTADGSYSWNGTVYTESGEYTYTTEAANGCDSIVTLNLTVRPIYTVTLVSANEAWGTVSESGTIVENGYYTATATANDGYEFVAWMNGSVTVSTNATYVFQVTEDITLTAVFQEKVGIEDVDMDNVSIYSTDTRIFVRGAEGQDVYVYDVNGRVMDRQLNATDAIEFRMTATGVYLVKVGNAPAKRVVVVR